jgi:hypothetical protein
MGSLRRVEGEQAGSSALGILIPPARRTFVILRPRALPWDLILCRGRDDLAFRQLSHDEASAAAQALYRGLIEWSSGGTGAVEVLPAEPGRCRLLAIIGPLPLVVCRRVPGQPYAVLECSADEAARARETLTELLCPVGDRQQEVYFNTRFFERTSTPSGTDGMNGG